METIEATAPEGGLAAGALAGSAAAATATQFVTFHIENGLFAVPLAEVQEIIRMPALVHVPLSPLSLEGLANLRGTVMAITSLRRVFSYPDLAHDDATRVVVINQGVPVGLVVDRMAAVVSVLPGQIEPAEAIEATLQSELLRGVIRLGEERGMIMILDCSFLTSQQVQARVAAQGQEQNSARTLAAEDDADEVQLVSFEVSGQEYALPIEHVQEIVQLPPQISRVPLTDRHVLGVMTLRDRLLPLVSLRTMFGLADMSLDERNKIVVVPLPDGSSVGVVMDMVREVLRVSRSRVDPVPGLLEDGTGQAQFTGICRLDGGKRLVTVLSAEALFASTAVKRATQAVQAQDDPSGPEQSMQTMDERESFEEEQFVVFRLADEEYGAPIAAVQEIVRVPDELTRIPKAPSFIRGVVNLRGTVLPVIDQRARFELPEMPRNDRQRIMVFTLGGVRTGFIIDSVSEVLKIARRAIGPAPVLSAEQARLISRVANLEAQKRMILLIAVEQLLGDDEHGAIAEAAGVTRH